MLQLSGAEIIYGDKKYQFKYEYIKQGNRYSYDCCNYSDACDLKDNLNHFLIFTKKVSLKSERRNIFKHTGTSVYIEDKPEIINALVEHLAFKKLLIGDQPNVNVFSPFILFSAPSIMLPISKPLINLPIKNNTNPNRYSTYELNLMKRKICDVNRKSEALDGTPSTKVTFKVKKNTPKQPAAKRNKVQSSATSIPTSLNTSVAQFTILNEQAAQPTQVVSANQSVTSIIHLSSMTLEKNK